MPLLKKRVFEKQSLPSFLRDDEEVFYCEITNEIFRDYEEFSERMFLYNSMVWTCAMTGKSNLTYQEALESEEHAKQSLKEFPVELRIPLLYLASKTKRSSFGDMAEDVFLYSKERYFVGENLETSFTGSKWKDSHVLQVISPSEEQLKNVPKNGNQSDRHFWPPANQFKYEIEHLDADDNDISEIMIVDCNQIRRKKGVFSRERCKLFLKQYTEQDSKGIFGIKESVLEDFGINKIKFDQIFDGPLPQFEASKKLDKQPNTKKGAHKQETLAKFLTKNNANLPQNSKNENKALTLEEIKKREEEFQLKRALREEEKLILKKKQKDEYKQIKNFIREWSKAKEDLLLEDQMKLPTPAPVNTKVPDEYFGDVLLIMEFIESFSKFLSTKDFFPSGFRLEMMERALVKEEVAGPFIDIVQMFLQALFNLQDEESNQYRTVIENATDIKEEEVSKNLSLTEATRLATLASSWSSKYQGLSLGKLPLYSVTVSEILRLHLLSSGARINETGARWRYAQRGGYTSEDDPGLHFRISQPHILKALAVHNVVQLPLADKLQILQCLINQLLTYADVRDVIEERLENIRKLKIDLRNLQVTEKKREQDLSTARLKMKNELKRDKKKLKEELEKLEQDNEKKQMETQKNVEKISKELYELQPLMGTDRANRKYYKFSSIPAILVSNEDIYLDECLPKITKQRPELVNMSRQQLLKFVRTTLFNNVKTEKIGGDLKLNDKNSADIKVNDKNDGDVKVNGVIDYKSSEVQSCNDLLMCTADPSTCRLHSFLKEEKKWSFFYDTLDLDELEKSLNKRGVRERELLQVLKNDKSSWITTVSNTPVSVLNPDVKIPDTEENEMEEGKNKKKLKDRYADASLGYPTEMATEDVLENALLENILELEEKIHAGNLGSLQVKNRDEWRTCLSNKNYREMDTNIVRRRVKKKGSENDRHSRSNTPEIDPKDYQDPGRFLGDTVEMKVEDDKGLVMVEKVQTAVKCLSIALAQVAQAVERKYLKKPLGCGGPKSEKKQDYIIKWEQSLLASTSFSQVFLHYGTLDSCIIWTRSALLARCTICSSKKDSENMLLCDNCNHGTHLYCLKPKLTSVPKGDWFCQKCKKEKEKEAKLKAEPTPVKKRRIFRDEEEEESNDSAEEQSVQDEDDFDMEDDDFKLCTQCSSGGELITCEKCDSHYHIECCEPPLRRAPRLSWLCHKCSRKDKVKPENSDSDNEIVQTKRNHRREDGREDLPLHNAALQELLSDVMKQDDSWPFLRPVQTKEVPDYYEIITNPMDFGTIKYKLNMGEYKTDGQLMKDVVLIFENCNTYNDSDADVYKCGVRLLKFFEKRAKELGLKLPEEMEGDNEPKSKKKRSKL